MRMAQPLVMATLLTLASLVWSDTSPIGRAAGTLSFTDVTLGAGVGDPTPGGHGTMFADVDNDGLPDLYITMNYGPLLADWFFHNVGGGFVESGGARGIADVDYGSHGAAFADLDNDGDYDLINGTTYHANGIEGAPNDLFRNNGAGYYADVTPGTLLARAEATRAFIALDMDRDGDLDLFGVSGWLGSADPAGERNEVYRNDGGFHFSPITGGALSTAPAGQGATDTDYDGDGDIDVIAANSTGSLNILRNDGAGNYTLVSAPSLGIVHTAYSGITMGDIDGDGDLDMVLVDLQSVTSSETDGHLYRNNGNGTFSYVRSFSSIDGYTAGLADLDNDGDLDLVFAGDGTVYLNNGAGGFMPGPPVPIGGINDPRGIAFADIDGDGDLDFAIGAKSSRNWLIRNDLVSGNWLKVRLVSPAGQAGAFGAKVRIYPAGGIGGQALALREARSNYGYVSQNDPVLHFGLGSRGSVDVRVTFLDGTTRTVLGVTANQTLLVDGSVVPPVPPSPPPGPPPPPSPPCTYALSTARQFVGPAGGAVQFSVTTQSGCSWDTTSGASWIGVTGAAGGAGAGVVTLQVAANTGRGARSATVQVAGQVLVVAQGADGATVLDFDADGIGDVFRYDPSTGRWTLDTGTLTGGFNRTSGTWSPGWTIHAADLNGDGLPDLMLYNPVTGNWYEAFSDGSGGFSYFGGRWSVGWQIHPIRFDLDGRTDLLLYNDLTGQWYVCRTRAGGGFDYMANRWSPRWEIIPVELDGDGRSDLVVYNELTGQWYRLLDHESEGFLYEGTAVSATLAPPPELVRFWSRGWTVIRADFDGDGRSDLLLYNQVSGQWYVGLTRGTAFVFTRGTWLPGRDIEVGDFDGDGRDDLFLYDKVGGSWLQAVSDGQGSFTYVAGQWSPGWSVDPVDFDFDGRTDLLVYNSVTGDWYQERTVGLGQFAFTGGRWDPALTIVAREAPLP